MSGGRLLKLSLMDVRERTVKCPQGKKKNGYKNGDPGGESPSILFVSVCWQRK